MFEPEVEDEEEELEGDGDGAENGELVEKIRLEISSNTGCDTSSESAQMSDIAEDSTSLLEAADEGRFVVRSSTMTKLI